MPPPPAAAASTPDAARVTARPSAPAPVPTPAALPHPIAAAAAAARQANLRRPPQRVHLHLPPAAQHLPPRSASSLERPHEVTGSAYGLQPHQPVSDVRAVVSAAVVLTPPCGSQLAARISTTSGAVHLFREHLRAIAVRSAYGGTRQRVGVPRFLVANGALSKSSTPKRSASFGRRRSRRCGDAVARHELHERLWVCHRLLFALTGLRNGAKAMPLGSESTV